MSTAPTIPIGTVFGEWTVIGPPVSGAKRFQDGSGINYLCRCSCGAQKYIRRSSLVNGKSRKCHPGDSLKGRISRLRKKGKTWREVGEHLGVHADTAKKYSL